MKLKEQAEACLERLGKTPEEVADSLFRLRITGDVQCEASCPLAVYLEEETGVHFDVSPNYVEYFTNEEDGEIYLPDHLVKFVRMFDDHRFPGLEKE